MIKSNNRIQFITDYISNYEEKIKLLNINGLFDSAKLFELFAIEVGSLYFGQKLKNLNIDTYAYPCVDLISEDMQTYIQVSTVKDIPTKVKRTLEKIRDSDLVEINKLRDVKFFVLNNDSVDKVKDYIGNNQIGSVPFTKANDLITTKDIIQKSLEDLDFQMNLYALLKREVEGIQDNLLKFQETVEDSKTVGLSNIDSKINGEYEIDRSELISKIRSENYKNISIQGVAGIGKSVLCKKIVEEEENVIYARAERFLEETDINNIWGFNVRQTLKYLNNKPVIFLIDSLEFIADVRTKLDLLCVLYECTKNYSEVKIITSCRTSDKNAFIKIENNYSVCSYEIPELTIEEQLAISKKYPIIKKMLDINSYNKLLKSPFYINLIVSEITDINNISDENQLREYIWQHIICLDDSKVKEVVESIVFTRAKNSLIGADSMDYDKEIIKKLISKGVLINNEQTVRLKYDIFEDICFEKYLDNEFIKCKGKYDKFFNEIEIFGMCIYRRYQIWISNKLFVENNREKFLYELVFSANMPENWRKQTEIGLVKSRYCQEFFNEYGQELINNKRINEFIKVTNLYAFEIDNDYFARLSPYIRLRPCGEGRGKLINLIVENKLYKEEILRLDLEKICIDYSKVAVKEKRTVEEACIILQYIIEKYIVESEGEYYHKLDGVVNRLLASIYQMAKYCKGWIKEFWGRLKEYYLGEEYDRKRLAENIIEDTLKFKHTKLAEYLPMELCNLAEIFWIYSPNKNHSRDNYLFYGRERDELSYQYGLSERAAEYEHSSIRSTAIENNFFFVLFKTNFWEGLNWTIDFVNKAVSSLAEKQECDLLTYEINFLKENLSRFYLGVPEMWLATLEENRMPTIISDLLYCLKEELRRVIENDAIVNRETAKFANNIRRLIYEKSNNIALLTIIADIGMEFHQKLPGYALDLTTNIDIILIDLARLSLLVKNPISKMLENQIYKMVGIPSSLLPDRYNKKNVKLYNLQDYVIDCQIYYDEESKIRCHSILDYLYSIVPDNKDNAINYLQIKNMDLRTVQKVKVDDSTIALVPVVTGDAEKLIIENEKQTQPESEIELLINCCNKKISEGKFKLKDCIEVIELLLEFRKNVLLPKVYDKFLIDLIVWALNDRGLDNDTRARFCQIWIDGIRSYFSMESFIFEYNLCHVLFIQLETEICNGVKNQIKQLILDLILIEGQNGVVRELSYYAKQYLVTNKQLAKAIFFTIIKLSEDEMNHQKYNAEYIKKYRMEEEFSFYPNLQPKLLCVDGYIEDHKGTYKSKKDEIINEYLFDDTELDLSNFDIENYDITTICYAINCGLSLDNESFAMIVKKTIISMIDIWSINENKHDIFGIYSLYEVVDFFQRELIASEMQMMLVLDILFTEIDFSKFTRETRNFYLDVFGSLLAEYFDSYSDKDRRANCEKVILSLENKIESIKEEKTRIELYKSLILSITRYGGSGDWSKCPSGYTYKDKKFLNYLFSKYGSFHLKEMLNTMYKLHLDKLLPEIILSVSDVFRKASVVDKSGCNVFEDIISNEKIIVLIMITKAYLDFSDEIKQDHDLTKGFEEVLEILTDIGYEEAATILDEFRVH